MNPLPSKFSRNGFNFILLKRSGKIAVFEKRSQQNDSRVIYEVIRIQQKPTNQKDVLMEAYPTPDMWGREGFSLTNLEKANKSFERLVEVPDNALISVVEEDTRTVKKRGRKPSNIVITYPEGKFTVKDVASSNNIHISYIHNQLKPLVSSGKVRLVGTSKLSKGRGKPTNVYEFVENVVV